MNRTYFTFAAFCCLVVAACIQFSSAIITPTTVVYPPFEKVAAKGYYRSDNENLGKPIAAVQSGTVEMCGETLTYTWMLSGSVLPHTYYCTNTTNPMRWSATYPQVLQYPNRMTSTDTAGEPYFNQFHRRTENVMVQRFERGIVVGPLPKCFFTFGRPCSAAAWVFADDGEVDVVPMGRFAPSYSNIVHSEKE